MTVLRQVLSEWDGHMTKDSAGAAVIGLFQDIIMNDVLDRGLEAAQGLEDP